MVVSIMLYNVVSVGFVDKNLFSNTFTWCYSLWVFFKNLILNFLDDRIFPILGVTWTIYIYLSETDLGGGVGGGGGPSWPAGFEYNWYSAKYADM